MAFDPNQQFLDRTMNRAQLRACRAVLRLTKDLSAGLVMARRKGWVPECTKAVQVITSVRPVTPHVHPDKNNRALALSLGVGHCPNAVRPSAQDKNKKHRLRRALRRAGWVLGC